MRTPILGLAVAIAWIALLALLVWAVTPYVGILYSIRLATP